MSCATDLSRFSLSIKRARFNKKADIVIALGQVALKFYSKTVCDYNFVEYTLINGNFLKMLNGNVTSIHYYTRCNNFLSTKLIQLYGAQMITENYTRLVYGCRFLLMR